LIRRTITTSRSRILLPNRHSAPSQFTSKIPASLREPEKRPRSAIAQAGRQVTADQNIQLDRGEADEFAGQIPEIDSADP
jgi:hypothetical protein